MWMRAGSDNYLKWEEVQKWVTNLNRLGYAGYQDWRLPAVDEAASLMKSYKLGKLYIDPAFSDEQWCIWTGNKSKLSPEPFPNPFSNPWCVSFLSGEDLLLACLSVIHSVYS